MLNIKYYQVCYRHDLINHLIRLYSEVYQDTRTWWLYLFLLISFIIDDGCIPVKWNKKCKAARSVFSIDDGLRLLEWNFMRLKLYNKCPVNNRTNEPIETTIQNNFVIHFKANALCMRAHGTRRSRGKWGLSREKWGLSREKWGLSRGKWGLSRGKWGLLREKWGLSRGKVSCLLRDPCKRGVSFYQVFFFRLLQQGRNLFDKSTWNISCLQVMLCLLEKGVRKRNVISYFKTFRKLIW